MRGERNEFSLAAVQQFQPWAGREAPGSIPGPAFKSLFLFGSDGRRTHCGGAFT